LADCVDREPPRLPRAVLGFGDLILAAIEALMVGGIVWSKRFHPLVVAGAAAWVGFRLFGFYRRTDTRRKYAGAYREGLQSLARRDFPTASSAFQRALRYSHDEPAVLGDAYSPGMAGDMAGLLQGARVLFRGHLFRRAGDAVLSDPLYRAVLAEPAFRPVRARLTAVLSGEVEELSHLLPAVLRRRLVQILVGLASFTLLALIITSALTYL